jgi:hypothetical protein
MNPPSGPRPQLPQQKQKTLRMQKHENTLEFHSRLIEAAEVRFSRATGAKSSLSRLSFSSTQHENVLPFRRINPIWFGQAIKENK